MVVCLQEFYTPVRRGVNFNAGRPGAGLFRPAGAVLDGLGDVLGLDDIRAFQIGDGEGELEDAVEGAGGEVKLFHGGLEQALGGVLDFT